jgi:hypothetical protein
MHRSYTTGETGDQNHLLHWINPGLIGPSEWYRIKRQLHPQKILITEVIYLFLGNPFDPCNVGRIQKSGYMRMLENRITAKLNWTKLDKEMNFIQHEDSAGILLNAV